MSLRHFLILFILFLSVNLNAQNAEYAFQKEWQEIDSLILEKDLTKSALEKVKLIYQQAKEKKLSAQKIKSLIYQNSLEENINVDNQSKTILFLQKEITNTSDENEKAILNVLLAKQYRNYFLTHQWNIYNRKTTINFVKEDLSTWGVQDFSTAIATSYQLSLQNKKLLQQTYLDPYEAVLIKGNSRSLRPTLYDLLAHEALDYFTIADMGGLSPAVPFNLNDKNMLAPAAVFLSTQFISKDSTAPKWKALQQYQQLMEFHKNDNDKDAFIQIDLERIEWVYGNLNLAEKETVYKNTLQELINQYSSSQLIAKAWLLMARLEADKAKNYQPFGDTSNRYGYVKAQSLIEKALAVCKQGNNAIDELRNLSAEITTKNLRLEVEKINVPYKPFRALASYRNSEKLFIRIIRIDNNDSVRNLYNDYSGFWKSAKLLSVFRSESYKLPVNTDYQTHAAEIKINGLPVGEYALLSSNKIDFNDSTSNLFISFIHVSNISYVKNKNDFFVLNRETGTPMEGVKVTILKQQFINRLRKMIDDTVGVRTTNKNGYFRFEPNNGSGSYRYIFTSDNDKLNFREPEYNSPDNSFNPDMMNDSMVNNFESSISRVMFFTDRAIYRPGQTIFFKGISITQDPKTQQSKLYILKDSFSINLKDVNGKILATKKFLMNSFGSFSGQFELPQNTLTGVFRIEANPKHKNGYLSQVMFSVEEYKRPKFSIAFDKVKGSYRLNDSVTVTGYARALAGNSIDGAKVKFNITRALNYNGLGRVRSSFIRNGNVEISHGEIQTDLEGKFSIRFKATADETVLKEDNPIFSFNIHTDITDLSGETRTGETIVMAGFSVIKLGVVISPVMELDSLKTIPIRASNFAGEKEPANVSIKIYSLDAPGRSIRKRYWEQPDQFIYSEGEFLKYFPTDEYSNESVITNWKNKELILEDEININTSNKDQFLIKEGVLTAGSYKIEVATKDKYGEEAKETRYVQLFDSKNTQLPFPTYQFSFQAKTVIEPTETAGVFSGSSANSIFVISKSDHPLPDKSDYYFEIRKAGIKKIQFTARESDRGGVRINEMYIIDNRIYTSQFYINVPFSNKALRIRYATYRNNTEPGSSEKWSVTVKGNDNEKVDAELITGMYDASLDLFRTHNWNQSSLWSRNYNYTNFASTNNFMSAGGNQNYQPPSVTYTIHNQPLLFDRLANSAQELWRINENGISFSKENVRGNDKDYGRAYAFAKANMQGVTSLTVSGTINSPSYYGGNYTPPQNLNSGTTLSNTSGMSFDQNLSGFITGTSISAPNTVVRKNFNETAFFFPQLYADTAGNYSFSFTMPEALTQWKWMSFAHTKDLATGMQTANIITQKTLMVQPNAPRFLREGDNIEMNSKIVNLSDKEITGQVTLELLDAATNTSVDGWFQNIFPSQYFTVEAGQSVAVKFPIQIPFSFNRPLKWRIVAKAGEFSDGEENTLPVITNRTLVTETLPLFLSGDSTRHFVMDKLVNNKSETLTHQSITVEYTSNPVWSAVQALPYLMEYPYECAEQTFNRFYANALGAYIVNKHPRIKQILEKWKTDSVAMKSNLQKNEALKQILLEETPWVLQAENEEQQKKNIGLLFDLVKLGNQTESLIEKLNQLQLPNGAFPWFKGGYEDRHITNYILTGIGKLKRLGAISPEIAASIKPLLIKALKYTDEKIADDYSNLIKNKYNLTQQNISSTQIDYLYMRSFFRDIAQQSPGAYDYYYKQGKQFWIKQNTYYKAQLGLIYYRTGDEKFAINTILPALTENAVTDSKLGMYWKSAYAGYWYQSPIEHQSMMIAFMSELNNDNSNSALTKNINAMKTWLLLNKQTNNWKTTIATADACYALLLNGTDWLSTDKNINIQLGKYTINSSNEKTEVGSGYFKKRIDGKEVNNAMGNIVVSSKLEVRGTNKTAVNQSPSWGSVYWQYFEDLDKITPSASPLSINKKLFIERNTDKGKVLDPVNENDELKVGDKIVVRLELRSDRDMDYLHLKDMRASSMEPVNVLSGYKWQDGFGYYESTKDVSSNFFIDHLRKGTYVFDYPLFITHAGLFSVGIAAIQSMYAPEFNSHSEGIKIRVSTTN